MSQGRNKISREEKLNLMMSLMWDYNISPDHCLQVLEGKRKKAGHYTETTLFKKLVESYRWFTILKILPVKRIYQLLNDDFINSLRFKSLSKNYEFIRKELHRTLQISG